MKRNLYPAGALLAGMVVSHLLFTVLIHGANQVLQVKLAALESSGYLVVPNAHILGSFTDIFPAFCGAVFFTLTIGAGMSLLAFAGAWMHVRWFGKSRLFMGILMIFWAALIAVVNADGFNTIATLALVIIPISPYLLTRRWLPVNQGPGEKFTPLIHITAILIVAAVWIPRLDGGVFIDVRDLLLLESRAGKAVNTFYYRYTLYPAELFKTLDQKMLKTAWLDIEDPGISEKIEKRLVAYDYLPVSGETPFDVLIYQDRHHLVFSGKHHTLKTTSEAYLSEPGAILKSFSEKNDINSKFRLITLANLIIAFPLSLYVIVHAFFSLVTGVMVRSFLLRTALASLICAAIGIGAALPLYAASSYGSLKYPSEIQRQLENDDWRARRRALQAIANQKLDPFEFRLDRDMVRSPHVALRYWLVQSLGNSRHPDALPLLLEFVDDPQPNVACMAFYGLGQSGRQKAKEEILNRIEDIDHWYIQWYAYKSLKRLGWTQKKSDTAHSRLP